MLFPQVMSLVTSEGFRACPSCSTHEEAADSNEVCHQSLLKEEKNLEWKEKQLCMETCAVSIFSFPRASSLITLDLHITWVLGFA